MVVLLVEQIAKVSAFDLIDQGARRAFEEHGQHLADHFEMRQFFRRDIQEQIPALYIRLRPALAKVSQSGTELAVWPSELLKQHFRKPWVGLVDAHRVHHLLVM